MIIKLVREKPVVEFFMLVFTALATKGLVPAWTILIPVLFLLFLVWYVTYWEDVKAWLIRRV